MITKTMLKIFIFCVSSILWFFVYAQDLDFEIIPEASKTQEQIIKTEVKVVAEEPGHVRDKYREISEDTSRTLWDKMASGIMDRDTILDYVVYLVKFMSQLGLLIGALMFIYAWYMYATQIMWWDEGKWKKAMTNAIIWVVVLSFSFAILKIVTNMFIE